MANLKKLEKAIKLIDANPPDERTHNIIGDYSAKWDKHDGYFIVYKKGAPVAYRPDFDSAVEAAKLLYSKGK